MQNNIAQNKYKAQFPLESLSADLLKEFKLKGVSIFGTGNYGAIVLSALKERGIKVNYFIDNNFESIGKKFQDVLIISAKELKEKYYNENVIIASLNHRYLKRQLDDLGFKNYFDVDFLFNDINFDKIVGNTWNNERILKQLDLLNFSLNASRSSKNLNLNSLDIVLTEKCSLKCKHCSNLMQYYEKPIDNEFDDIILSIENFFGNIDYCYEIRLIGGEPLLFKKIDKVIEKLMIHSHKFGKIIIYTNGTIVPKGDRINAFKNNKIQFSISNYGEISRNVKKLEEKLSENKISFISERVTRWQNCAIIKKFERSEKINKEIFGNCCVNETLTLLHGKLYLCPFSAHIENLKVINKQEGESINLTLQNKELKSKIRALYFGKKFLNACNFCNGRDHNVESIPAAEQTKQPLSFQRY